MTDGDDIVAIAKRVHEEFRDIRPRPFCVKKCIGIKCIELCLF